VCWITHHSACQTADVVCIGFDLGTYSYMAVDSHLNSLFFQPYVDVFFFCVLKFFLGPTTDRSRLPLFIYYYYRFAQVSSPNSLEAVARSCMHYIFVQPANSVEPVVTGEIIWRQRGWQPYPREILSCRHSLDTSLSTNSSNRSRKYKSMQIYLPNLFFYLCLAALKISYRLAK
jgi:hypothetical protein